MAFQLRPLAQAPVRDLLAVLNDERIARHMPLWGTFTPDAAAAWVHAKALAAAGPGLGPQAVWVDGRLAGWAGIQAEGYGPDLAVVLAPWAWGVGADVAQELLHRAALYGLREVFIALPPSRHPDRVVARLGFARVADDVDGFALFRRALDVEHTPGSTVADMTLAARPFATTQTPITPIALGAMIFGTRTPEAESRRILDHFIGNVTARYPGASGMVDTADCYCWWEAPGEMGGHSESLLGRWLTDTGARDRVFLATKATGMLTDLEGVWGPDGRANWDVARHKYVGAAPHVLRDALAGSLERLQTDSVDLYYNHVDDRKTPLPDAVGTFASFVAEGTVRAYGWSNVATWRLGQIRDVAEANGWPQPAALQQQHSYLARRAGLRHNSIVSTEQLDYLRVYPDLRLVAYSPVLKGLYSDPAKRGADFWALDPYRGPDADAKLAAVDRVAAASGATGNQVVLAWMLAQDAPSVVPLIGPRTFDQYLECIEALDVELTRDQLADLNGAGA